jgi:hypothetical protein
MVYSATLAADRTMYRLFIDGIMNKLERMKREAVVA